MADVPGVVVVVIAARPVEQAVRLAHGIGDRDLGAHAAGDECGQRHPGARNRQNPGHGFPSLGRYLLADAIDDRRAVASEMQALAQPKSRIVQAAEGQ